MPTFIMLSCVAAESLHSPPALEELENKAVGAIRTQCPHVKWLSSYAAIGPYDFLDIFEAPNIETATKVSTLIRTHGRSSSEVWAAADLEKVKQMIYAMPP